MTVQAEAPVSYDPYDYAMHEDPYPTYARLRAEFPLYRNEELDFFALSRYDDVASAFRRSEDFSNSHGVSLDPSACGPDAHHTTSFLAMDPPTHTRLRSLVNQSFTVRRIRELEPRIRAITLEHLAPALDRGSFDFIGELAGRVPMDVISELLGVPRTDRAEVRRLADLVVHREKGLRDVPPAGMEAALTLAGYYADLVADRRRRPGDDLVSSLMEVEEGGDRLTDEELCSALFLLVIAGNETTTKLLGNAWWWGWRCPEQSAKVLGDRSRVPDWVDETLRFDASTQMLLRIARRPLELHGTTVPVGSRVLLLVGSANRDGDVFPEPDIYDLDRDTSKLVSFGGGRHFCMGASLARLEARAVLEALVDAVRGYQVDERGVERVHSINVRGFSALPTTVVAR